MPDNIWWSLVHNSKFKTLGFDLIVWLIQTNDEFATLECKLMNSSLGLPDINCSFDGKWYNSSNIYHFYTLPTNNKTWLLGNYIQPRESLPIKCRRRQELISDSGVTNIPENMISDLRPRFWEWGIRRRKPIYQIAWPVPYIFPACNELFTHRDISITLQTP